MKKKGWAGVGVFGLFLILALTVGSLSGGTASAAGDLGYIDLEYLQEVLPQFAEYQAFYNDMDMEFRSFAQYKEAELRNTISGLEKEKEREMTGKSDEEKAKIEKEYAERVEQEIAKAQKEIENKRRELLARTQQKLEDTRRWLEELVEKVAKEEGVSIVLEKSVVFFGGKDLTEKIISAAKE